MADGGSGRRRPTESLRGCTACDAPWLHLLAVVRLLAQVVVEEAAGEAGVGACRQEGTGVWAGAGHGRRCGRRSMSRPCGGTGSKGCARPAPGNPCTGGCQAGSSAAHGPADSRGCSPPCARAHQTRRRRRCTWCLQAGAWRTARTPPHVSPCGPARACAASPACAVWCGARSKGRKAPPQ